MYKSLLSILFLILMVLNLSYTNDNSKLTEIDFVYKGKIIPFRDNPIITEKEIYFSQEDFVILMKFLGFVDWNVTINKDTNNKVIDCILVSNDMPKFKSKFIPLIHEEKIHIPFSSVNNQIGVSPIFDYDKGKIYLYPQIKDISVSEDSVVINGAKEIKIQKNFYLNDPLRFVIDLQDCVLSPDLFRQKILSSNDYIYQIRVSQFNEMPAIVRIVIELKQGQKVKNIARILPNQVQLIFSDRTPELYAKVKGYDYNVKSNEEQIRIYQITPFQSGNNLSISINIDKSVNYTINKLDDGRWYIDLYNTVLNVSANEIDTVSDFVKNIRYSQHQTSPFPITRIVITPRENFKLNISLDSISNTGRLLNFLISYKREQQQINFDEQILANTKGKVVVIDPGHGGKDPGAVNRSLGIQEKDITLKISMLIQEKLEKAGYKVILTRKGDYELTNSPVDSEELQARVNVGKNNKASLFVSVHINASTYSFANGVMTFYTKDIDYALAQYIHSELVKTNIFDDKGIRQANFYVLKYNPLPAVLLELGFITNYNDAVKLMSYENLQKLANAIAKGINNYLNKTRIDY
ncbi:MAG: N-acetylmuramoyl-L-alanine amidase [Candidatus Calescibacterium sp.]|nr:N-acetylmuramoyl-L-alanine amidase [Candidatus Calescibacterium sp.]MDW8133107.1 N-acetylmuramoyl-L-alanine amidase [Candidatus Calescibacterium sp.]